MNRKCGHSAIRRLASGTGKVGWKHAELLLVIISFCVVDLPGATAVTVANSTDSRAVLARDVDLSSISYERQWCNSLRTQAKSAEEAATPYLANRLWKILAGQGDPEAAFHLGLFYDTADGQDHDAHQAVYWYQRAANAGEIHAQHNLAVAYAKGDGVDIDINKAINWWTVAARRGNADSQYNLGILYAAGEFGIKKDIDKAKHWWRKAAIHGDPMAQYNLGTLYVDNGVNDYCEAVRWWQEAARNGVQQASMALRIIKKRQDYQSCQ